ncbi:MAG: MATE family efflux transporter [Fusobacteriaceae bacterium]
MGLNARKVGLFTLAIPILLELLLMTVVGNVDIIMVSKYSDKAVGVLGGMSQVMYTQNILFSFISIGTGILISQYIGAKNKSKIQEVIAVSLVLNTIFGLVLGIIYWAGSEFILTKIKFTPDLISIGLNYFKIVGGICIFQAITLTATSALRSHGYTKETLYINIIINLINVLGNGMFIFGWLGAPILGVTGVGIATVFSRGVGMVIALVILLKFCDFKINTRYLIPFPKDVLRHIAKIGIPSGMEHLSWSVAQIIILAMVNTMGTATIAARTYLNLIASFMMMFSIALGQGTAIVTGRLIGEKKIEEAYHQCLKSVKLSLGIAFIISISVFIFQNTIMEFFTKDPEIISIGKKVFWTFIIIETGRTFNIIIINSLHAAGDVKFPMFAGIACMFGIAVSMSWFLGVKLELALVGIWLGNSMDEWVRAILMLRRWKSRKWEKKGFI